VTAERTGLLPDSISLFIAGLRDYDVDLLERLAAEEKAKRIAEGNYDPSYERLRRDAGLDTTPSDPGGSDDASHAR
jgi:hypothetical protein